MRSLALSQGLTIFLNALLLLCLSKPLTAADDKAVKSSTRPQAYVTLLYDSDFLLGVRVLGQSLRDTSTTRDLVVIVAGELSEYAQVTLQADGWLVHKVDAIDNPNMRDDGKFPSRFHSVYSKLHAFGLTQYDKVIFLDADTVVVHNIDELFGCPGFCATLRHSERFNSGVMAITPSKDVFESMLEGISSTKSYTGGDQGFLNEFFSDFASSPVFDPAQEYDPGDHTSMMIPTRYNADIGLYVFNSNRWLLDGQLKVVHYTLGSFKPWAWWCGWLIEEQARWNKYRMRLGPDEYGRRHGVTLYQAFAQTWMPLLPPLVFLLIGRGLSNGWPVLVAPAMRWVPSILPRSPSPALGIIGGFLSLGASAGLAFLVVPAYVTPSWGWILVYEYTFLFMFIIYGKFLHIVSAAGRAYATTIGSLSKGLPHHLPWSRTALYAGILATMLLLTPFLNTLLGVPGFVPKILLAVAGALITNTVATHMFAGLCQAWFYQT